MVSMPKPIWYEETKEYPRPSRLKWSDFCPTIPVSEQTGAPIAHGHLSCDCGGAIEFTAGCKRLDCPECAISGATASHRALRQRQRVGTSLGLVELTLPPSVCSRIGPSDIPAWTKAAAHLVEEWAQSTFKENVGAMAVFHPSGDQCDNCPPVEWTDENGEKRTSKHHVNHATAGQLGYCPQCGKEVPWRPHWHVVIPRPKGSLHLVNKAALADLRERWREAVRASGCVQRLPKNLVVNYHFVFSQRNANHALRYTLRPFVAWNHRYPKLARPVSVGLLSSRGKKTEERQQYRDNLTEQGATQLKCPECGKPVVARWGEFRALLRGNATNEVVDLVSGSQSIYRSITPLTYIEMLGGIEYLRGESVDDYAYQLLTLALTACPERLKVGDECGIRVRSMVGRMKGKVDQVYRSSRYEYETPIWCIWHEKDGPPDHFALQADIESGACEVVWLKSADKTDYRLAVYPGQESIVWREKEQYFSLKDGFRFFITDVHPWNGKMPGFVWAKKNPMEPEKRDPWGEVNARGQILSAEFVARMQARADRCTCGA